VAGNRRQVAFGVDDMVEDVVWRMKEDVRWGIYAASRTYVHVLGNVQLCGIPLSYPYVLNGLSAYIIVQTLRHKSTHPPHQVC
jgi:hypothetical protein